MIPGKQRQFRRNIPDHAFDDNRYSGGDKNRAYFLLSRRRPGH